MHLGTRALLRALIACGAAGAMLVSAAAGNARPLPLPLIMWSSPASAGGFGPFGGSFDFGAVAPGQSSTAAFTLTNRGGAPTGALSVALTGGAAFAVASDGCSGSSLGAGRSCVVTVTFAPAATGRSGTAALTARGRATFFPAALTLTGPADLEIAPSTTQAAAVTAGPHVYAYDFGNTSGGTQTFTVTNEGNNTARRLRLVAGAGSAFVGSADVCTGATLAPGQSCSFAVAFTADAACYPGDTRTFDLRGFPAVDYAQLQLSGECAGITS